MSSSKYPSWVTTKTHQKMHDDFRVFLWWLWKQLGLPEPTPAQYEMALWLQHGPRKRIVMAFRGIGKSWITAAFVLWLLMRNPQEKVMVVSASEYKAIEFSTFTKQLINTLPLLSYLLPRPSEGQRNSTLAFDVGPSQPAQAPSVRAVGIGGQMTGGRATRVIFDDIEVPNNSETEGKREKLDLRAREMGGAILVPGGHSIGLGTPQSIQTIYTGFEERGYKVRIWPARIPDEAQMKAYGEGRVAPSIVKRLKDDPKSAGKPADSARFDEADLIEREAEYGRSGFRLQFMLDSTLSDADRYPLKFRDLIIMDVDPEVAPDRVVWASGPQQLVEGTPNVGLRGDRFYRPLSISDRFEKYESSVMVIDPSGRGKDETSYAVGKQRNGFIYTRRWGGLPGGYDDVTLQTLAEIAKSEQVNLVLVESNFGDGMFTAMLQPVLHSVYPCRIDEYHVSTQKEMRIADTLEPVMNQHRLVMDAKIVDTQMDDLPDAGDRSQFYNGFYQMAYMSRDRGALKQDDRIDALAAMVGHFTEQVARDTEKAAKKSEDKRLAKRLDEFMVRAKALSGRRGNPSFHRRR